MQYNKIYSVVFQGATIKTCEETGKIVIARVMHGGAADRSGLIHAGDEVIEVNGISVENKTPADVLAILVCTSKIQHYCYSCSRFTLIRL